MFCDALLREFTEMSRNVFGENLLGIYLHGSLAMNCFNPQKSDIDLILVVRDTVSFDDKLRFTNELLALDDTAPEKGFELSIVKKEFCQPFTYPTPFEYHFSHGHKAAFLADTSAYIEKMQGVDKDLGAHFTIINHFGIPLYGPPVREVFAPVPKKDYFDSIWYDVEHAQEDILGSPMYIVLNLCRVLGYARDGLVLSKKTGGEWGAANVPQPFDVLVQHALQCYLTDEEMTADEDTLLHFAEYMVEEIKMTWTSDPKNVTGAMLTDMGICPTCYNRAHDNCFFTADDLILFENERFSCELVDQPRAKGHVVIVSREHYKDMMEIPDDLCSEIYVFAKKAMNIIKEVYGAESVYLCTMCDGPMNHFHVQLIPRYADEKRGSKNFVKPRQVYTEDKEKLQQLREKLNKND